MSKVFGLVNGLESHNKSHQLDITLDKFWVTQRGWIQLCTTVCMGGGAITIFWKLFFYGVKRYQYEKFIGTREFLEQIAVDCFNNNFTIDTGIPENKYLIFMALIINSLCIPAGDSDIPVLLLVIKRSA